MPASGRRRQKQGLLQYHAMPSAAGCNFRSVKYVWGLRGLHEPCAIHEFLSPNAE